MKVHTSDTLDLSLRGVAIKSGALQKMEEDKKNLLATQDRFTPIGIKPVKNYRPDMAGGFRMFENEQNRNNDFGNYPVDPNDPNNYPMMNPLSKEQIMRNLGIDNPEDEFEIDWSKAGINGTAKSRVELADKLLPLLKKEQEKLQHRRNMIKSRIDQMHGQQTDIPSGSGGDSHGMGVEGLTNMGFESQQFTGMGSSIPMVNPNFRINKTVGTSNLGRSTGTKFGTMAVQSNLNIPNEHVNFMEEIRNTGASLIEPQLRSELATQYGIYPGNIPYKDEVDIMAEDTEKFQEVNHWYSSLEKPNEQNVEVLKQLNHRRLAQLQSMWMKKRNDLISLQEYKSMNQGVENPYRNTRTIKPKSKHERNQEKKSYKDRFKKYLHNKSKNRKQDEYIGVDFDRYECTSPNPKRVRKDYHIEYKEMQRVDPSGMTEKQLEEAAEKMNRGLPNSQIENSPKNEKNDENEEEEIEVVVDWIWHKMNPNYQTHVSKSELITFILNDEEVKEVFDLKDNYIVHIVESMVTERPDHINYEEFYDFLLQNKAKKPEEKDEKGGKHKLRGGFQEENKVKKECLLTEEQLAILKENFEKLDKHGDLVVPRAELISSIKNDVRMKKYMDRGVVFLPSVNKEIAMRKVLHQIEQEEFLKAEKLEVGNDFMSTKRYISWAQFLEYFTNYSKNEQVTNVDLEFKRDDIDDQNVIEVPKRLLEHMKETFEDVKDEDGYTKTTDFINSMMVQDKIRAYFESPVRAQARYGNLPPENFEEVVKRVQKEADDYIDWDEFIQYFTKRGIPKSVEKAKELPRLTKVVADQHDEHSLTVTNRFQRSSRKKIEDVIDKIQEKQNLKSPAELELEKTLLKKEPKQISKIDFFAETNPLLKSGTSFKNQISEINRESNHSDILDPRKMTAEDFLREHREKENREKNKHRLQLLTAEEELAKIREDEEAKKIKEEPVEVIQLDDQDIQNDDSDSKYSEDSYVEFNHDVKKITIPDLTGYQLREEGRESKETIQSRKFKEWMNEKQRKKEKELKKVFRARPIPKKVREPLYDKIVYEQELRREEVKKNSIAITRANEAPFSFYERNKDKDKKFKEDFEEPQNQFKAKEVPWFCSPGFYEHQMANKEQLRKEKINRRAQEMLSKAKLPPRMEKHEQERKQQQLLGQNRENMEWEDDFTFQPPKAKPIPNFEKAQKQFQRMLDKKRAFKKPTKIKEFNFTASKKVPRLDYLEKENEDRLREQEAQKNALRNINKKNLVRMRRQQSEGKKFAPSMTKKFKDQVEINKQQRLQRRREEERRLNDKRMRQKRMKEVGKKVRTALAAEHAGVDEESLENRRKKFHKQQKEQEKKYKENLKKMKEKVANRSYSFQNYNSGNEKALKLKKMKTLLMMHDKYKKNGIQNWQNEFTREEVNMIEDAKVLRKLGKLDS